MTEPLASDELALQAAARLANVSFALLHRRLPSVVSGTRVYWTLLLGHHVARGGVDGDFVETGVYKGGTTIAMLRVLAEANASRSHWACDSFEGLPDPEPQDAACPHAGAGAHGCAHNWTRGHFASSRAVFEENVRKWSSSRQPLGLQRLRVVPGWFNSTLPSMGMRAIAFLRLDGDAYSSTRDALAALYPLMSPGGIVYVDDYGGYGGCAAAVDEYRRRHAVTAPLQKIWERFPTGRLRVPSKDARPVRVVEWKFEAVWWQLGPGGNRDYLTNFKRWNHRSRALSR